MSEAKTVLVSGASGLVGRALCRRLVELGHSVRTLGRSESSDVLWDLDTMRLDAGALEGVDAVVHLAGESVAQRWTEAAKARIRESRVRSTSLLAEEILKLSEKPDFICASGSNFYGYNRGDGLDESTSSGEGFLAEVCREWEGAAQPLVEAGVRTVFLRTGVVLSAEGGALAKMLPAFKAGGGGRIGSGKQWMSWVSVSDLVAMYVRAIEDPAIAGAVNAVAPTAVTNVEFTKALGALLKRPTILPLPAFAVRAMFGEMGNETVLADVGLVPQLLKDVGFEWEHAELEDALCDCLAG